LKALYGAKWTADDSISGVAGTIGWFVYFGTTGRNPDICASGIDQQVI
jgi:hypothetical protein